MHLRTRAAQYRLVSILALISAVLIVAMVIVVVVTGGVGQEAFEHVSKSEPYSTLLAEHAAGLRVVFSLDYLFIFAYGVMFFVLLDALGNDDSRLLRLGIFLALLGLVLLDFYENHQFVTMIEAVEQGLAVSQAEIAHRTTWSQLKWHTAFFGLFGLGFLLGGDSLTEKLLRWSLWTYLPLVGVLTYTWATGRLVTGLLLYIGMLGGFVLLALVAHRRASAA